MSVKYSKWPLKIPTFYNPTPPKSIPKVLFLGIKIYRLATLVQPFVPFVEQIERFLFKSGSDQLFGASQTFKFCH
jgi:hypothetical protein